MIYDKEFLQRRKRKTYSKNIYYKFESTLNSIVRSAKMFLRIQNLNSEKRLLGETHSHAHSLTNRKLFQFINSYILKCSKAQLKQKIHFTHFKELKLECKRFKCSLN